MGNSIINQVITLLKTEGFAAGEAFPGGKPPMLTEPAAAVSIHGADWRKRTVTVCVHILCPESLGAVRCQSEALRAGNILSRKGAWCSQGRCGYDGLSGMHTLELLAEFYGSWQSGNFQLGTGSVDNLTFKTFTWPVNPETYREELVREPVYVQSEDGWTFQGMGEATRVITGSGVFSGANAAANFQALAALFSDAEAGTLTHPLWGSRNVHFTELALTQSAKPEYISYSFQFREADSDGNPTQ